MAAPTFQKYNASIIDPDLDTRMRLKQATTAVHNFGKVHQLTNLREGLAAMNGYERVDVVFLSYRFDEDEVKGFIKEAKETPQGQDAAYVLVLRTKDQDSSVVAKNVMIGADGFLFEPYSVDYLLEITELAARVRKERSKAREEAAIKFLVTDVINHVDMIAYLKSCDCEVGRTLKKFKEICSVFETLDPESKEIYYKIAIEMFIEAPIPQRFLQRKTYRGASQRVKRRMEDKLLAELEQESKSDGEEDSKATSGDSKEA